MEVQDIVNALLQPEGVGNPYPLYAALHELALAGLPERRAGIVLRGFEHLPVTLS